MHLPKPKANKGHMTLLAQMPKNVNSYEWKQASMRWVLLTQVHLAVKKNTKTAFPHTVCWANSTTFSLLWIASSTLRTTEGNKGGFGAMTIVQIFRVCFLGTGFWMLQTPEV